MVFAFLRNWFQGIESCSRDLCIFPLVNNNQSQETISPGGFSYILYPDYKLTPDLELGGEVLNLDKTST